MTKILVFGANGGIGSAFIKQCKSKGFNVIGVSHSECDLTSEQSIQSCINQLNPQGPFDYIFVATGVLHSKTISPEKSINQLDLQTMNQVFEVNAFGPILLLKACLGLFDKQKRGVFSALSARVGSISDNRLGGWYSYRASKSALNMLLKTASIECTRKYPNLIIAGLHPGTVDTGLSEPFQVRVKEGKLFTPEFAAENLWNVMSNLSQHDSGNCYAWDGQKIPF